nr:MAG TPA: hypothetical protein [Caudoviricetes sp.]
MAGRTLIDGVYKTIKGGNALVDGVSKKIKCGKVLIDGVSHNIPLENVLTLTSQVTGVIGAVIYNGNVYSHGSIVLVSAGDGVTVMVGLARGNSEVSPKMYIKLNGKVVARGSGNIKEVTYSYRPASDATITFIRTYNEGGNRAFAAEIVES